MKEIAPSCMLTEEHGGNLTFSLSLQHTEEFIHILKYFEQEAEKPLKVAGLESIFFGFFKLLQKDKSRLIKEWVVSHATLEEVFIEVSRQNNFIYDEDEGIPESPRTSRTSRFKPEVLHSLP